MKISMGGGEAIESVEGCGDCEVITLSNTRHVGEQSGQGEHKILDRTWEGR
jgi:hypothetical protein